MAFGLEIKRLREDAKISVEKLAAKIGVKSTRWRKWEEKDLTPRDEDSRQIEEFFKMDLEKIMELTSIKKFLIVPHEKKDDKNEGSNIHGSNQSIFKQGSLALKTKVNQKDTDIIIVDLAASSRDHAAADLKRAEAEVLREQNHKRIIDHITKSDSDKLTMKETVATILALNELIVDLDADLKHRPAKESQKAFDKMVKAQMLKLENKGS